MVSSLLISLIACLIVCQCQVEQWDMFELTMNGPSDGNPFVDYYITANFTFDSSNDVVYKVNGFYDDNGIYKIRFMPNKIGKWSYITNSNVAKMSNIKGTFTVIQATSEGNYGPVNVDYTTNKSFIFANGQPYFECGTTSYVFTLYPNYTIINDTVSTLRYCAENDIFNKVRVSVFPTNDHLPLMYPYIGTPPNQWGNYNRFNVTFWHHLDNIFSVIHSFKSPMIIDLILFHPYDTGYYGFDCMGCVYPNNTYSKCPSNTYNTSNDELYLKYLTSRLGAYRNVWYNMCNEFSKVQTKSKGMPNSFPTWDRLFKVLQNYDIYDKEISIHQCCNKWYNYSREWITHFSVQGDSEGHTGSDYDYQWFQTTWNVTKPVVLDEVSYEGAPNGSKTWINLTVAQETDRFWMGNANGNMVVHGDAYIHWPNNNHKMQELVWFATGDFIPGGSWKKIGWFYKFMTNQLNGITKNFRIHPQFHELKNFCFQYFPKYPHCNIGSLYKENEYYLIHFSDYEDKINSNYSLSVDIDLGNDTNIMYELSYIDYMNETIHVLKNVTATNKYAFTAPYSPYNIQFVKL